MRIALAACLVFVAVWFVALRPKPVDESVDGPLPTAAEPARSESTPAADKAAADKAQADKAETPKAADEAAEKKAAPARKVTDPEAVVADVQAGRTVVLLFSSAKGTTDDRAVRDAVAGTDRHDGKVRVHTARISQLPQYEAITRSVPVTTSPTVLVINGQKQATTITGLTTTREIDKQVDAALAGQP